MSRPPLWIHSVTPRDAPQLHLLVVHQTSTWNLTVESHARYHVTVSQITKKNQGKRAQAKAVQDLQSHIDDTDNLEVVKTALTSSRERLLYGLSRVTVLRETLTDPEDKEILNKERGAYMKGRKRIASFMFGCTSDVLWAPSGPKILFFVFACVYTDAHTHTAHTPYIWSRGSPLLHYKVVTLCLCVQL